ncbi:MAG: carbon-nitrogen hydrolase family protein [Phycisphaerales bacterium]
MSKSRVESGPMRVAIGQISPVFLDRARTVEKVKQTISEAADAGASLVAFGETLVPAYPLWLGRTGGARFDDDDQKTLHALYLREAVDIRRGDLDAICSLCAQRGIATVLGVAELGSDRGGHTIYCSAVFIGSDGAIGSVHRKLMPTYEERLSWGVGDGHGLRVHPVGPFTVGALNCWENWMPLARTALHGQGENLHIAIWPGCERLTRDITRFVALEGRSYVVSASSIIREQDIPAGVPLRDRMVEPGEAVYDGGSCIAAPDGSWLVEPVMGEERLIVAELDPELVRRERQNFDPSGHYARPDVLRLDVDRRRDAGTRFQDS